MPLDTWLYFPSGHDRLHLLQPVPPERAGPAGGPRGPLAIPEHRRVSPPTGALRPLLPAGPAGAAPAPEPAPCDSANQTPQRVTVPTKGQVTLFFFL